MVSLGETDLTSFCTLSSRVQRRTSRSAPARLSSCVLLALAVAAAVPQARAQAAPAPAAQSELVTARVARYIEEQTRGLSGKVQITVNALDERSRVAACDDMQVFLPAGARLWGSTSLGVRCTRPQPWQIYVPATVRVTGQVVFATRALAPGAVVDAADVGTRVDELTLLPPSVLLDPAQAVGRTLVSGVPGGAPLRNEQFKQVWAVTQGQTVRIQYESETLRVTADGKAIGNAAVGQTVDVRVSSGKTVRGVVRGNGIVVVQ